MTWKPLSVPQINLLLALLHFDSAVTTKELAEVFAIAKVESQVRDDLVELGYVSAWREGRSFRYELTDAGWKRAREVFGEARPAKISSVTARVLWVVCNAFGRYMDRHDIALSEVYAAQSAESALRDPVARVREAYAGLAAGPAAWVPLRKLRDELSGFPRDLIDEALTTLLTTRVASLIPEENQKILTDSDRAAALRIGGEDKHHIAIERL